LLSATSRRRGIYVGKVVREPWLRLIVEGAIRRQAFNIIQDTWKNPADLPLKELVIGRGGLVASRNYELDSGAYFFQQIYDYYVADDCVGLNRCWKTT
jgi:meiotically up-regulated gene 157 (Mug157) protein